MSAAAEEKVTMEVGSPESTRVEFERIYRESVGALSADFARRRAEPQTVADLTSETIVRAVGAFSTFDARRGTARAWLFGIAANVFARHCAQVAGDRDASVRPAGRRGGGAAAS